MHLLPFTINRDFSFCALRCECLWDSLAMTSAGPMLMPMMLMPLLLLLFALLLPEGVKNYKIATKCKLKRKRKPAKKKKRTTIAASWKITLGNPISNWPFSEKCEVHFLKSMVLWCWIMQGLHYRWISMFLILIRTKATSLYFIFPLLEPFVYYINYSFWRFT